MEPSGGPWLPSRQAGHREGTRLPEVTQVTEAQEAGGTEEVPCLLVPACSPHNDGQTPFYEEQESLL